MKLSDNFNSEEFACKCGCGFNIISPLLVEELQRIRNKLNAPITIDSGCRCVTHNKAVGGTSESFHKKGLAADFTVKGYTPKEISDYLNKCYHDKYGIGVYPTWVHFDVRPTKARW